MVYERLYEVRVEELVKEAREKGLKLRFVAEKKGGLSGERYKKYRRLTTVAQCDAAKKRPLIYSNGRLGAVMLRGDLVNDVQKGICEVMDAKGFCGAAGNAALWKRLACWDASVRDSLPGGIVGPAGAETGLIHPCALEW